MAGLRRTPLYPIYEKYGAKTIDFGGWELPVQFSSIKEEHEAVRTKAGLFDVSHMGEITVSGPDALAFLQKMMTNDVSRLVKGQAQYTAMCYPDGGTVDDLLIYCRGEGDYLLVVNAANIEKDEDWLQKHAEGDIKIKNISSDMAQLALQGPLAESVLQTLTSEDLSQITFFRFKEDVDLDGTRALVSRTGYTGEDGFEIYLDAGDAIDLWEKIMEAGKDHGVLPCGLGARDTLRFEARLPLYGNELGPDITPIEAGIGFAVKVDKEVDFIGKEVLKDQKENGAPRKLVGIEMIGRGIPRHGYPVFVGDTQIGHVTTGTQSPTLKKNVGLVLIDRAYADLGQEVQVEIRHKRIPAKVVKTPFYQRPKQ
ncbi:aminomethyltransferase [Caldalkalibacillus thermarum]|uniref:glycine cleavage system aminomethyltransferase GcvT n=1 Tax=Caldalkalibacillus thermarum TaxID=296745 RepID=UPI00166E56F5|nr:glycine cleavage system aminomethyltransferase GcvT [Caldalkalibacillus thermarum]GGK19440.1 aminomethyltransferase [Caldalkalibacillus thermarum]